MHLGLLLSVAPLRAHLRLAAPDPAPIPDKFGVLSRRVASAAAAAAQVESEVSILLLDCMVPKQRFELTLPPPVGSRVKRLREEGRTLCVLGMQHRVDPIAGPQFGKPLRRGVEGQIEALLSVAAANPDNFFAETEQAAFHIGHIVPGIDFTLQPLMFSHVLMLVGISHIFTRSLAESANDITLSFVGCSRHPPL